MRKLFLFCVLLAGRQAAAADDPIVLLIVDGGSSPVWNSRHTQLVEGVGVQAVSGGEELLRRLAVDPFGSYRDINGQKGYITTITPSGSWATTGFVTLKSPEAFDLLISDKLTRLKARMGDGLAPQAIRSGDLLTVKTPAHTWKNNPQFSSRAHEIHYRHQSPVLINGIGPAPLASLKRVPLKEITTLIKPARGKLDYYLFRPGAIPERFKLAALQMVARKVAPGLQLRDTESKADYKNRRSVADAKLSFLRSILLDVGEVQGWTEWPEGDEPFRVRWRIEAKKKSRLHQLFTKLRSASSQKVAIESGNVGNISLTANLPPEVAVLLNSWLQGVVDDQNKVEFFSEGVTRLAGRLDLKDEQVQFVAIGQAKLSDAAIDHLTKPREMGALIPALPEVRLNYSAIKIEGGVSLGMSSTQTDVVLPTEFDLQRSRSEPLATVEMDLAPLVAEKQTEPIGKLLRDMELAYTRTVRPARSIDLLAGRETPDAQSVLKFAKPEGDWKIRATLELQQNIATLNVSIGADAHRLWRLRQLHW